MGLGAAIKIESERTGRKRERMGVPLRRARVGTPPTFRDADERVPPILSPNEREKDGALDHCWEIS